MSPDRWRSLLAALRSRSLIAGHVIAFAAVIGAINVWNVVQGAPWWAFYPSMVWGLLLTVHFFVFKAMTIDEDWVDERAAEIREHSYDFDHMQDLQKRIAEDDFSVHAHTDDPPKAGRRRKED
jgi:hypothetical protein